MPSGLPTVRAHVPLRLGLAGGGTDLSPYCDEHGGAVLNTTINRYAFASIEPSDDGQVHFLAPDMDIEEVFPPEFGAMEDARLALHAAVMRRMVRQFGDGRLLPMRVTSHVDAPPGSGLGSSSALVVALVEAFTALLSAPLGPYDVAHLAYEVERVELRLAGGKQDQYSATFGGTNYMEFHANDRVIVNPLRVPRAVVNELETSMVVCFSGVSRRSEAIISEQQRAMAAPVGTAAKGDVPNGDGVMNSLHQMKRDAVEMKEALLRGEIGRMATILNRSWEAKKRTASGISTGRIEELHELAFANGAIGGKVSGAGGGGFMMFIVPPARHIQVVRALNAAGGDAGGVHFTTGGAQSWFV
jgi:D-glycero-alpha-D-manno-heptose-7-phosphate kinase